MSALHQPIYTPSQVGARRALLDRRAKPVVTRSVNLSFQCHEVLVFKATGVEKRRAEVRCWHCRPEPLILPSRVADLKCGGCEPQPIIMHGRLQPSDVINAVGYHYRRAPKEMLAHGRFSFLIEPRQVAMYLMRDLCANTGDVAWSSKVRFARMQFIKIGRFFNNRHHTTIMNAVERIGSRLQSDWRLRKDVSAIKAMLHQGRQV